MNTHTAWICRHARPLNIRAREHTLTRWIIQQQNIITSWSHIFFPFAASVHSDCLSPEPEPESRFTLGILKSCSLFVFLICSFFWRFGNQAFWMDLQILNIFYARSGRGPLTTFDSILIANAWLLWIFSTHFCQSLEFAHFFVRFSIHCLCFLFNSLLSSQLIFHSQQTNMDCQQSNVHALVNLIRLVLFVSETRFTWMMFFFVDGFISHSVSFSLVCLHWPRILQLITTKNKTCTWIDLLDPHQNIINLISVYFIHRRPRIIFISIERIRYSVITPHKFYSYVHFKAELFNFLFNSPFISYRNFNQFSLS